MRSILLVLMALSVPMFAIAAEKPAAKRDVASLFGKSNHIVCSFTEPFFEIDVNIKAKTMKVTSPMGELMDGQLSTERTDTMDNLVIENKANVWTVTYLTETRARIVLLTVDKSKKGSDGMSERVYDATGTTPIMGGSKSANNGIGGCNFHH